MREAENILNKVDVLSYGQKKKTDNPGRPRPGANPMPDVRESGARADSKVPHVRAGPPPGSGKRGD